MNVTQAGGYIPATITSTRAITEIGCIQSTIVCGMPVHATGQRRNTRMKVNRYSASGMTQKRGMAAMSVVRYVVTPSMRLLGAAARPIQRSRRPHVGASSGGDGFTPSPNRK